MHQNQKDFFFARFKDKKKKMTTPLQTDKAVNN